VLDAHGVQIVRERVDGARAPKYITDQSVSY
jgi:hypothetical protein